MECTSFVEEKVGETRSAEFREHLTGCAGCRRDLEEMDEVRRLYREASTERLPARAPRRRALAAGAWSVAAAAAVLVAVLVFILKPPPSPNPSSAPFARIHLEPWDPEDAMLNLSYSELWGRLEHFERSRR